MTEISNIKNNWVYQENSLIESSYYLTTSEQKLIRILASLINKDDEEFKEYSFTVSDLAKTLNINPKNAYRDLENIATQLMTRYIKIRNPENTKDWVMFNIIKTSKCSNGLFTIKIDIEMKDFYLSLQQYTKYRLRNILEFKNKHTFRIYEFLKQFENINGKKYPTWERIIDLKKIKEFLELTKKYAVYSDFKKRVLIPTQKEICEKTDIWFEFEEIKTGGKTTAIKFIVHSKKTEEEKEITNVISLKQIKHFIEKFNSQYNSNLAGTKKTKQIVIDLVGKKGLEHFEKCFEKFPQVIGSEVIRGTIRSLEGLFMNFVKNDYNFNTGMIGGKHEANFDQREYTKEDFEKYYYKVSENI